jgi:hypothetical protein
MDADFSDTLSRTTDRRAAEGAETNAEKIF